MKRVLAILISFICLFSMIACEKEKNEEETNMDTPKYDLERYMTPIWEGNVVYNESVALLLNEAGDFDPITLTYDATEIVSVRSARLDKLYVQGKDYFLENGKLKLNKDSGYLKIGYNDYYIRYEPQGEKLPHISKENTWLYYSEGSYFHDRQLAVTYKHESAFPTEYIPKSKGENLTNLHVKLSQKEPVRIVLYGASNDTGCNSSSYINVAPFAPIFPEMLVAQLRKIYGYEEITIDYSLSKGGMSSDYGVEQLDNLMQKEADLIIVDYGINDAYYNSTEKYAENMKKIVDRIQQEKPATDIILAHGPYTNPEVGRAKGFEYMETLNQMLDHFGEELYKLEKGNVVVADFCKLDGYILTRKRFVDYTANNINHNNDFKARLVAQTLIKTIEK